MTTLTIGDLLLLNEEPEKEVLVPRATVDMFLEFTSQNPDKNFELIDGQIIAMAGASNPHNTILSNLSATIGNHFLLNKYPCIFYVDSEYHIGIFNYVRPDFAVVCNQINKYRSFDKPIIVGEIYSSNRDSDIKKLEIYKNQETIQEIFMIEQEKFEIVAHRKKAPNIWEKQVYGLGDTVTFESIDYELPVEIIYNFIKFDKKGKPYVDMVNVWQGKQKFPTFLGWEFCLKSKQILGKIKTLRQVAFYFLSTTIMYEDIYRAVMLCLALSIPVLFGFFCWVITTVWALSKFGLCL